LHWLGFSENHLAAFKSQPERALHETFFSLPPLQLHKVDEQEYIIRETLCRMRRATAPEIALALSSTPIIIIIKCRFRSSGVITASVTRKIAHFQMHANTLHLGRARAAHQYLLFLYCWELHAASIFMPAAVEVRKVKMEISRTPFCLQVQSKIEIKNE
jgi:hypothetical protein